MADFSAAETIINDAAVELGLKSADITDPFGSTDPNIILLVRLLKRVGRSLVRARDWSQLTKEYNFPTVNGTFSYALPADFDRMKDETQWNRTTVNQLGPPVDGRAWQEMKARTATAVFHMPFRVWKNLLYVFPTPTTPETIYYEYVSNRWSQSAISSIPTNSNPILTDTIWFDEALVVAGLKLAFARAKSLPTTALLQDEFNQAYEAAAGADVAGGPISISGGSARLPVGSYPSSNGQWGV